MQHLLCRDYTACMLAAYGHAVVIFLGFTVLRNIWAACWLLSQFRTFAGVAAYCRASMRLSLLGKC